MAAPNSLRLVAWNVCGGLGVKQAALFATSFDVAIVSEVHRDSRLVDPSDRRCSWSWKGRTPAKGLAVIARSPWSIVGVRDDIAAPSGALVVSIDGPEPFELVAVWTVRVGGGQSYSAQLSEIISVIAPYIDGRLWVLGGDLNAPLPASMAAHHRNVEALSVWG